MKKIDLTLFLISTMYPAQASQASERPTTPPLIRAIKAIYLWGEKFAKVDTEIDKAQKSGTLEATGEYGYTAIHYTRPDSPSDESFKCELLKKLIKAGSSVNAKSLNGQTVLHLAVIYRDPEAVRILLEARALINAQMDDGRTPLHLIIASLYVEWTGTTYLFSTSQKFQNKIRIAHTLLSAGARKDIRDGEGRLPLEKLKDHMGATMSALHALAHKGEIRTLRTLAGLGMYMHPEKSAKDRTTPLHEAGTADIVTFLLAQGANVHATDNNKRTPLHTARNGEVALALLAAGANPEVEDNEGYRPLHSAAATGNVDVIRALLGPIPTTEK